MESLWSQPAAKKVILDVIDLLDVHESVIVCTQAYRPSEDLSMQSPWEVRNNGQWVEKEIMLWWSV